MAEYKPRISVRPSDATTVQAAAAYAGVSSDTVRRWCIEEGLGNQPGGRGRWRVSAAGLLAYLADDKAALVAMRAGAFDDPRVQAYLAERFKAGARNTH